MFDIQEYYKSGNYDLTETNYNVNEIESDISLDIDRLLKNRFDRLYLCDRYKYQSHNIDIIYPRIIFPENRSLIMTADKIRFLLSLYPGKDDLRIIERIVLRPRYIEIGSIELSSLFIQKSRILVLYLCHPHMYRLDHLDPTPEAQFVSMDLLSILDTKKRGAPQQQKQKASIHPLWYYISVLSRNDTIPTDTIDKFFIRKNPIHDIDYQSLIDISCFYSRHGY